MSTFTQLLPLIYHERQEKGSALCAQHALNNLLQENCFSVPDLSAIAQGLDELEQSYNEGYRRGRSGNMDDTGFFSVQVLQKALEVWSLSLVSWRSEEMSAYTDHPHTQLAFILNLNEHWFTLRRFGATPRGVDDLTPGQGHWFNLNSFLRKPEWVGKLYLSMVLEQSEAEGYSVFVVKRTDPTQVAALPGTEADRLAARLPDPNSGTSSLPASSSHTLFSHAPDASRSPSPNPPSPNSWQEERSHSPMHQLLESVEHDRYIGTSYPPYLSEPPGRPGPDVHEGGLGGFERLDHPSDDPEFQAALEDRELQAALQASLESRPGPVSANQPFFDAFQPHTNSGLESPLPLPIPPPLLPGSRTSANRASATASTRRSTRSSRNRRSMSGSGSNSGSGSTTHSRRGSNSVPAFTEPEADRDLDPMAATAARSRLIMERMRREQEMALRDTYEDVDMEEVSRRSREAEEEEEMLKRAIEESEKMAQEEKKKRQNHQDNQSHPEESSSASPTRTPSSRMGDDRVYDDEDEELQAALRASLQDVPPGYQPPPSPPPARRRIPEGLTLSRKQTLAPHIGVTDLPSVITPGLDSGIGTPRPTGLGASSFPRNATVIEDTKGEEREKHKNEERNKGKDKKKQKTGDETDSDPETEIEGSFIETEEEEVSVEEMRRRRLARFGG